MAAIALVMSITWAANPSKTSAQDPPDQPTGLSAEVGDTQVRLSWNSPAVDSPSITDYQLWQLAESTRLTAPDRTQDDGFAYSVAVEGDTAAIGVPGDDYQKNNSGSVFVYTRGLMGNWSYKATLTARDPKAGDKLGHSVALQDDTIVAGAPEANNDKGKAYVFTKPVSGWVSTSTSANLVASATTTEFGWSVAVDGDTVVVGAYKENLNTGAVYVFTEPQNSWDNTATSTETARLTASGPEVEDEFGRSVAVEDSTIVVGADGDDGGEDEYKGSAFVFTEPAGGWVSTSTAAKLTLSDNERGHVDFFGTSVALDSNTIVVGAEGDSTRAGAAYVFIKPDAGGWVSSTSTAAKLTDSDVGNDDLFGASVALDGDTIVVGARQDDDGGTYSGAVYVFIKSDSGWVTSTEADKLIGSETNSEDDFGRSVSVHGGTILVGAPDEDDGAKKHGAAYVFDSLEWEDIDASDSDTTSHLVTGLTNNIRHTFRVRAANMHGPGVPSDPAEATPTNQAPQPTDFSANLTGFGEVTLSWTAGSEMLTATGYQFTQDNGRNWHDIVGSSSSTVSHIVSELAQGSYTFAVRAVNVVGNNNNASDPSTSLKRDVYVQPAAPDGLTAVAGDKEVALSWDNPGDGNITEYQYYQQTVNVGDSAGEWFPIADSSSSTASTTVTGLINGVGYIFRVRGVNPAGDGHESVSVSVSPRLTKPTGLSAQAGDTQVRLRWDASDDDSIIGYELWQHAEIERLAMASSDRDAFDEFGYSVAVEGDTAVIGVPGDDGPDNSGAVYVYTRDQTTRMWDYTATLTARDPKAGDRLGLSVALWGNTIVAGAPKADGDEGAAYVFTKFDGTDWVSTSTSAKLAATTTNSKSELGWSVAVHGDTVVVGAHKETVDNSIARDSGAVYVFTKPQTGWADNATSTQTARLTASGRALNDRFGRSVAVEGTIIVVGANGDDNGNRGSAFVFTKPDTGGWVSTSTAAKLTLPQDERHDDDRFGSSVALEVETIVVGAQGKVETEGRAGAAYVFLKPDTGGWVSSTSTAAKLTGSDVGKSDLFGASVSLSSHTIVVGANGDNSNRGSAYVFTKSGSGWTTGTEAAKLIGSETNSNDVFGLSVSVHGATVLVGAKDEDASGTEYGAAYVFDIQEWTDISAEIGATTTSHIATDLTNDIRHTFRVRAVNGGPGDPSVATTTTPEAAASVPVKPRNFSAVQTGAGEVLLEWGVSAHPLTVTGYQYKQDDEDWEDMPGSDYSTNSYAVSGLTNGATYTFAVRAVNSFGGFAAGDSSDPQSVTIVAKPKRPTGLSATAGDTQVLLSWAGPDDASIEKFQFQRMEAGDWDDIDGSGTSTTSHLVTGLTNDTRYTFRVRAVNAAGYGEESDAVDARPRSTGSRPATPADFAAAQIGVSEARLSWDAVSDPLTVTGYQYQQNGEWRDIPWEEVSGRDSDTFSYTVSGLSGPDPVTGPVTYTFAVRAVNSSGSSDPTDPIDVTIVAKPRQPTGVSATAGDTQATVDWDTPDDEADRPVSKYQLLQVPVTKLIADDRAAGDEFGYSVAMDGDTAVIGAYRDDDNGSDSGAAYVFTKNSGVWVQEAKLTPSDGAPGDEFGHSVAVRGDTIVIGAHKDDQGADSSGTVYIFTRADGGWTSTTTAAKLTAFDREEGDRFGHSVAVAGNTVVVGAYGDDLDRGAAYVFTKPDGSVWTSTTTAAKLTASDGGRGTSSGFP